MPPRKPVTTSDGDALPALPADHDVMAAIHLLEYARSRGFRVGPYLIVGSVKVQIRDVRQEKLENMGGVPERSEPLPPWFDIGEPEPGTAG